MAGHGPTPKVKDQRVGAHDPQRGDWVETRVRGWQFGDVPPPPDGLMPAALEAWSTWFLAWFAAFWTADDLPGLRQVIRLYDQVERGEFQRHNELRLSMDTYGITPKGQQDRRWKSADPPTAAGARKRSSSDMRDRLTVVHGSA